MNMSFDDQMPIIISPLRCVSLCVSCTNVFLLTNLLFETAINGICQRVGDNLKALVTHITLHNHTRDTHAGK